MASERQSPDAILASTNLTGSVADIDDDPDSPDSNWLTATSDGSDTMVRTSFPTPTGDPTTGAGLQEFRIQVRNTNNPEGDDPSYSIHLYENGADLGEIASGTVSSSTGEVLAATWNASLLGTADGSLVEAYIYGTVAKKDSVEIGAVEWNVEYSAGTVHEGEGQSDGLSTAAANGNVEYTGETQSDGTSTSIGSGACDFVGIVQSDGVSTATGIGTVGATHEGTGNSDGLSTASGTGNVEHTGISQADGSGIATASGDVDHVGSGQSDGVTSVTAAGNVEYSGTVQSDGVSTSYADGEVLHTGAGQAYGIATVVGAAEVVHTGTGQTDGTSTVSGSGVCILVGVGQSNGTSTAIGTGETGGVLEGAGQSDGLATTIGSASVDFVGAVQSDGTSTASGTGTISDFYDVVCTMGVEEVHRFENHTENNAFGVANAMVDFSPSLDWTHPQSTVWLGNGDRKIELVGAE